MRLKKWGSLLTALAMVGSMATYVPATVSAAEAETETKDTVYSGVLDYVEGVEYELNVTKKTLVISPEDATKAYNVPANVLDEVAYEFVGTEQETTLGTATLVAGNVTEITFEGDVVINVAAGLITNLAATTVNVDCRAEIVNTITSADGTTTTSNVPLTSADTISTSADAVTDKIVHDYQANTTYHNHICANCNDVNNDYDAHKFGKDDEGVTIDKTAHTHTCACGKVDTEYLVTNEDGSYKTGTEDGITQAEIDSIAAYKDIHGFDATNHYCADCGAYDVVTHQGSNLTYKIDETYHTIACNKTGDTDCAFAEAAQKHTYAAYYNADGLPKTLGGYTIKSGEHYCTVCGYVPRATVNNVQVYSGTHNYNYKFALVKNASGVYEKKIVSATTADEKVVCLCGAVKTGHGDNATTEADKHNYVGANGKHLCICGDETDEHNYAYNYNGKGAYTVNGKTGFVKTADNTGAVCSCGDKNPGTSDSNGNTVNAHICAIAITGTNVYTDTTAHKHYCTCGEVITSTNSAGKTSEVHDYTDVIANQKHICTCGATTEEDHKYKDVDTAYYYMVAFNKVDECYELVKMTYDGTYTNYAATDSKDVDGSYNGAPISFNSASGVICQCGKVNPAHEHDFEDATMCIDGVHYCPCGAASEEHTYGTDNRCTVCTKYIDHACEPTSLNNCACKICGEEVHELIMYNTNSHKCVRCGEEVKKHVYEANTTKHTHVCTICEHVYDETTDTINPHRYGEEGEAQCVCTECGFAGHSKVDGNNPNTTDVTEKHYCTRCGKDMSTEHTYITATDKCVCGAVKPGHVCAFNSNASDTDTNESAGIVAGDELCKCGAEVAHEYVIANVTNHSCTHKTDLINCSSVDVPHTFDKATNTFCTVCGAVNFTNMADANTTIQKVKSDYTAFTTDSTTNYTSAFIVEMAKAYNAIIAYDASAHNDDVTKTLVAKTADEQAAFNALITEFNALLATKGDHQSGCSATIKLATNCTSNMIVPDANADTDANGNVIVRGQNGDTLTLKVVAAAGYKVEGWYDADPNATNSTANKLSSETTYEVTAAEGNKDYYVNIVKNDTVRIKLTAGMTYDASITADGTAYGAQIGFVLNEVVTISYQPAAGTEFLYFTDNNGKIYNGTGVDTNSDNSVDTYTYTFTVTSLVTEISAETFTPVQGQDVVFVTFKKTNSANSEIASTTALLATNSLLNLSAEVPTLPERNGMTFIGWAFEKASNAEVTSADIVKIKQVSVTGKNAIVLVPIYEKNTGYKPTITGGSFVNMTADQKANGFTYGDKIGITAPEMDETTGKYFSGWYVNGVFYDATRTTWYTVNGNDSIVAKFENDEPAEAMSYLSIGSNTSYDTGVRVLTLSAKWVQLDKDCAEIIDSGYVFAFSEKAKSDLTLDKVDGSTIRKKVVGETAMAASTNYPMTLKSAATKDATVSAVAYLTIRNADGEVETIYSDNMVVAQP